MSIKDITIIIASFKSDEKVKKCLNSINDQCKVIVVENSNNLEFKKNFEDKYDNVECIIAGDNLGYGRANNLALKKIKTKYALILNPDTILNKSTLDEFIKATELLPDFAILAPKEQSEYGKISNDNEFESVNSVKGFAMFLNLSKFQDIGYFDENFFLYFEDIDLCRRLKKENKKIYLISNLKITHLGAQSSDENIYWERELTRNWHWMWSTFTFHKKYNGYVLALLISLPKLFSSIFKILIYVILNNKNKKEIYCKRYSGLINAILGKNSWYRPKIT